MLRACSCTVISAYVPWTESQIVYFLIRPSSKVPCFLLSFTMHFFSPRLILYFWLSWRLVAAAITSSDTHTTTDTHNLTRSDSPTSTHLPLNSTKSRSAHGIKTSGVGKFSPPPPPPQRTPGSDPPPLPNHTGGHHATGQSPAIIFVEVLGGVIAFVLLIGILRCLISYQKTPDHDRISYFIHRHQLQREMEELERNPPTLHRSSSLTGPAPPPYRPPPPSYDQDDSSTPLTAAVSPAAEPRNPDPAVLPNG